MNRTARLVGPAKKSTVTQITNLYNSGEQKNNSE